MGWRRARRTPIGVEVTSQSVRLIQVEWAGDDGRIVAWAEVPRPAAAAGEDEPGLSAPFAAAVRQALDEAGFRGRRAVIGLPPQELILRHVKVDARKGQALHDALLFELEDAFPGDTPLVQHLEVGEVVERGERKHELILLAAGLERVNRLVARIEEAGLDPVAIDAEGCALIRCFMRRRRRKSDAEVHTAIIHVGDATTLMTITGAENALFMKQLPMGARQLLDLVAERLDLSADDLRYAADAEDGAEDLAPRVAGALRLQLDALSLELSACLRYHAASRRSPGGLDLFLCGRGAGIPGLPERLAESLDAAVQRPDPFTQAFSGVAPADRLVRDYATWSVPLGLALREEDG